MHSCLARHDAMLGLHRAEVSPAGVDQARVAAHEEHSNRPMSEPYSPDPDRTISSSQRMPPAARCTRTPAVLCVPGHRNIARDPHPHRMEHLPGLMHHRDRQRSPGCPLSSLVALIRRETPAGRTRNGPAQLEGDACNDSFNRMVRLFSLYVF
jgi:hypothetical protein